MRGAKDAFQLQSDGQVVGKCAEKGASVLPFVSLMKPVLSCASSLLFFFTIADLQEKCIKRMGPHHPPIALILMLPCRKLPVWRTRHSGVCVPQPGLSGVSFVSRVTKGWP